MQGSAHLSDCINRPGCWQRVPLQPSPIGQAREQQTSRLMLESDRLEASSQERQCFTQGMELQSRLEFISVSPVQVCVFTVKHFLKLQ